MIAPYTSEEIDMLFKDTRVADVIADIHYRFFRTYTSVGQNPHDYLKNLLYYTPRKEKHQPRQYKRIHKALFLDPLDEMAMYVSEKSKPYLKAIAQWRMQIGK